MNPIRNGITLAIGLLLLLGAAMPPPAAAQASKTGWWIRVDAKKTEANGIGFELGSNEKDLKPWRTWRANDGVEFDLSADFVQHAQIHLRAIAIPDDEDVWFCVFYKANGVRRFEFDTTEAATLRQTDRDRHCR